MALKAYVEGLPDSAVSLIQSSLEGVFEGLGIIEVPGKIAFRNSKDDESVVLVCISQDTMAKYMKFEGGLFDSDKFIEYTSIDVLARRLSRTFKIDVEAPVEEAPVEDFYDVEPVMAVLESDSADIDIDSDEASDEDVFEAFEEDAHVEEVSTKSAGTDSSDYRLIVLNLQDQLTEAEKEIDALRTSTPSDAAEVAKLKKAASSSVAQIEFLKKELKKSEAEAEILNKRVSLADITVSESKTALELAKGNEQDLRNRVDSLNREVSSLKSELEEIKSRPVKSSTDEEFNKLLDSYEELEKELEAEKKKSARVDGLNSSVLRLSAENNDLRKQISDPSSSQSLSFDAFGVEDMPNLSTFKNIMFVFSGSSESYIDTYRRIREFSEAEVNAGRFGERKLLIADLTHESFADYIFKSSENPKAVEWLQSGGNVNNYLSQKTAERANSAVGVKTEVYSWGSRGYRNDTFRFSVDWNARLSELNSSGYVVIAYMGSLSESSSRSLYCALKDSNRIKIYSKGNLSGVRSLWFTLKRVSTSPKVSLHLYDYMGLPVVDKMVGKLKEMGVTTDIVSRLKRKGS